MRKLIIPAILAAVVITAGIFVYAPVQKASTVHTTITKNMDKIFAVTFPVGNATVAAGNVLNVTASEQDLISGTFAILAHFETSQIDEGCAIRADTDNNGLPDATLASVKANPGGTRTAQGTTTGTTGGTASFVDQLFVVSNYSMPAGSIDLSSSFCTFSFDLDSTGT